MAREVEVDVVPRVEAAGRACRDAYAAYQAEVERRDGLIVKAIDAGVHQRTLATAAKIAPSRVAAILANSQPEHAGT